MIYFVLVGVVLLGGIVPSHGEICPIDSLTIGVDTTIRKVRDVANLLIIIEGVINGGTPSEITWYRNGSVITDSTEVPGGSFVINNRIFEQNSCLPQVALASLEVKGRLPGTYSFSATNANTSVPMNESIIIPESGPISNLTLKQVNGMNVQAFWSPPSNDVDDYRVFVNDNLINGNGIMVPASNNPNYTTSMGYNIGEHVGVHVRATTEYYWSVPVHRAIRIHALKSPEISSISTPTQVHLYISQPTASLAASRYDVTLTTDACNYSIFRNETTEAHRVVFRDLESGVSYTVQVMASNLDTGLMSNVTETVSTLEAVPSQRPGIPKHVSVTSTTVTLFWTALSCEAQNGIITDYAILYGQGLTSSKVVYITVNTTSDAREFTVTNLLPFTDYNFRVAAVNSAGTGPFSDSSAIIRTEEAIPSGEPGTPAASVTTATSITLTWTTVPPTEQNGVITHYIIHYGEGSSQDIVLNISSASTTFEITDLSPFTEYTFSVAAANRDGIGPFSEFYVTQTDESTPTAVRNLTGYPRFDTLLLVWLEPEPSNGIITSYTILYTLDELEENDTSYTTEFTIEDLQPGTTLSDITVFANTAAGAGPNDTLPYSVSTISSPNPVQNLKVKVLTSTSVEVTWDKLSNPAITHYVVYFEWTVEGEELGRASVEVSNTTNVITIGNLISGSKYTFEVQARDVTLGEVAVGPSSMTTTLTLPVMTITTSAARTSEGAYTAIVLGVLMAGSATVDWHILMLVSFGAFCQIKKLCNST